MRYEKYFKDRTKADPVGGRYAWNLQEVRLLDKDKEKQILRDYAKGQPDPVKNNGNIALRARVIVSSAARDTRPFTELIDYFGEGAIDGVVDPESKNKLNEWISDRKKNSAFIRLMWEKPERITKVWLFDRPDLNTQITSGMLVFSDGSTVNVSELPNDARSCRETKFPEKTVSWMAFIITSVSPTTENVGWQK